jgi:hypothetical protein
MQKTIMLIAIIAILSSCKKEVSTKSLNASAQSNATEHHTVFVTFDSQDNGDWNDPCTGEHVHLTGTIRVEYTNNVVGDKINSEITFHYTGLSGVGDISGMKYQGMGSEKTNSQTVWNADAGYYETKNSNTVQHIKLIAPGPNNNLVYAVTIKEIFDANHNLKVSFESYTYDACQ